MVDVQVGVALDPLADEVDELLERASLALAVVGPEGLELLLAILQPEDAEEVLEPAARLPERVALHVEEEVARRGLREQREAALVLGAEGLVCVRARAPVAELELGLVADVLECRRGEARDVGLARRVAELGERRDPGLAEPDDLVATDVGDASQVVVLVPPGLAELAEVADPAVIDRPGLGQPRVVDGVEEALADAPVVGEEVEDAVALGLAGAERDVHPLGEPPLDAPDLLGVEAKLEHVRRLPVPRELGVVGLVGAVGPANDEVGEPAPLPVEEGGLVDNLAPGAHRLRGLARGALPVPFAVRAGELDCDDVAPVGDELRQVSALVLLPLAPDQLSLSVLDVRLNNLAARDLELKLGQVLALEVGRHVGRREAQETILCFHNLSISLTRALPCARESRPTRGLM